MNFNFCKDLLLGVRGPSVACSIDFFLNLALGITSSFLEERRLVRLILLERIDNKILSRFYFTLLIV